MNYTVKMRGHRCSQSALLVCLSLRIICLLFRDLFLGESVSAGMRAFGSVTSFLSVLLILVLAVGNVQVSVLSGEQAAKTELDEE